MRLIDADEFERYTMFTTMFDNCCDDCLWTMQEAMRRYPAVDAVPVVRCKDCCHSHHRKKKTGLLCNCPYAPSYGRVVANDDFCSRGETHE